MVYRMFDSDGNQVFNDDLQNKGAWCEEGAKKEVVFINRYGKQLGLGINPDKIENKYAPDLINIKTKNLGDLKVQNTPFFKASILYDLDPQYTVVFNLKDKERYSRYYPKIDIYFWVNWFAVKMEQNGEEFIVEPMKGIWYISFEHLLTHLKSAMLHSYKQRKSDTRGNARSSYIVSLLSDGFIKVD
jgi:hypothetical protein